MTCWDALTVLTCLAAVATVAGLLGRLGWFLDLASHFRPHYFLILSLGALAFLLGRRYDAAAVSGIFALANAAALLPLYLPRRDPSAPAQRRALRIWLLNVNFNSRAYERTLRAAREADADILVLMEVSQRWMAAFSELQARYPHGRAMTLERGFGIALLSRLPLEHIEIRAIGHANLPSVIARLAVGGRPLTLVGTHPLAPQNARFTRLRNGQLQEIARFAASQPDAVMVLGDLNTTSWSPAFRDALRLSRLQDSRHGFGIHATWPAWLGRWGVPIDHGLVSSHLMVHRRRVGPNVGSDHLPLLLDVAWR